MIGGETRRAAQLDEGAVGAARAARSTEDEYNEFYKHVSHDWTDPLETIHMKGEGTFEYEALLFIPSRAPFDLFMRDGKRGVQLYVKRVFIMDDCEALMPSYLRFVKGVVDAHDLSLNISREILQQDRQIQVVRRRLVKKVLVDGQGPAWPTTPRSTRTFWTRVRPGGQGGPARRPREPDALLGVALGRLDARPGASRPRCAQYVERMKDGQKDIYYMTGESRAMIENSPHLEAFRAKGYEVLILTDPVDEVWVERVTEFDGKPLQSIAKGQVDLGQRRRGDRRAAQRGVRRPAALDGRDAGRRGQGGAAVVAADHVAGLHRRRRARHDPDAGEDVPGDGPGGAAHQAHPGAQPDATRW